MSSSVKLKFVPIIGLAMYTVQYVKYQEPCKLRMRGTHRAAGAAEQNSGSRLQMWMGRDGGGGGISALRQIHY